MGPQVSFQPYSLMSWNSIILLGDAMACPWTPKNNLWHFWVIPTLLSGARCTMRAQKKWSFYVFDSFYENWHGSSQNEYFCMGSFLATQIDPGATIYNLRVQLWQGFWGFRPLYMWILVRKNWVFSEKMPWKLPGCGRPGLKTSFY